MQSLNEFVITEYFNNEYIYEAANQISDIRSKLKDVFGSKVKTSKSHGHIKEIARGEMGSDMDEFTANITEILNKSIGNNWSFPDSEPKIYPGTLPDGGASSEYYALKIQLSDDTSNYVYIVNTTKSSKNANIKSKLLTPDNIGVAPDPDTKKVECYTWNDDLTRLISIINKGLDDKLKQLPDINDFCKNLISTVVDNDIVGDSTALDNVDNFNKHNLNIKLSIPFNDTLKSIADDYSKNNTNFNSADLARITNDFGEVVGSLVFMKIFKDVPMSYPVGSNNPLVDYYIGNVAISAKASGGGGKPSGAKSFVQALSIYNDVLDNASKKVSELYTKGEIEFFKEVAETYTNDNSIFNQQSLLIDRFIRDTKNLKHYKNKGTVEKLSKLLNKYGIESFSSFNTYGELSKALDKNDKFIVKDFFTELYDILNYNSLKVTSIDDICENWTSWPDKMRYGVLYYPLWSLTVKLINEKYATYKEEDLDDTNRTIDVISRILQRINFKQAYLNINMKSRRIEIDIHSSNAGKWVVATGGMSTKNINNSFLSISLQK